jgi:hypothetical protein
MRHTAPFRSRKKVRMVIELQGIALPLIARRRPLKYYEQ